MFKLGLFYSLLLVLQKGEHTLSAELQYMQDREIIPYELLKTRNA